MTELLSREKEFLELNEQLDKFATNALEQQHLNDGSSNSAESKAETRFLTYTKIKGQSTLLKKRTAGDAEVSSIKNGSDNHSNASSIIREQRQMRNNKSMAASTAAVISKLRQTAVNHNNDEETALKKSTSPPPSAPSEGSTSRKTATNSNMLNSFIPATIPSHRKHIKGPDSSTRTFSRTSHNRSMGSNTPFTIKYRNQHFVQSPSLELLVKEESASIRYKVPEDAITCPSALTDADSVTSTAAESSTISRRSNTQGGLVKKQISSDGLIKFLKSKITILEEDHARLSHEMAEQKELLEKTLERHKKVEQQRDQAYAKHNLLTDQISKVDSQLEEANRRLKERMLEQSAQQKELEVAKRELKLLTQTNINLEKRLYRANEELENTKNALTAMKNTERELKESSRAECESKEKQIKCLKKQRADLLNAYKKQLFLIDNLKRQNACLEQSKMIAFGEKEFTKVLDWNTKA